MTNAEAYLHPLAREERLALPTPPAGFHHSHTSVASAIGNAVAIKDTRDKMRTEIMTFLDKEQTSMEKTLSYIESGGIQRWHRKGLQMVYPEASMVKAFLQTDVLHSVTGSDVRGRSSSMMINWPKGVRLCRSEDQPTHTLVNIYSGEGLSVGIGKGAEPLKLKMPTYRFLTITTYFVNGGANNGSFMLSDQTSLAEEIAETLLPENALTTRDDENVLHDAEWEAERVEDGRDIFTAVLNLVLVMQSHPEYLHDITVKQRQTFESNKAKRTTATRVGRSVDVENPVPYDPAKGTANDDGLPVSRRAHTRNAHWRRQRHGEEFEKRNPDIIRVTMPDGGSAHMVWIEELSISSTDRTVSK